MTVSSIIPVNNYAGNGSTTIFDFDFLIESSEELLVTYINENGEIKVLNEGVDYSVNEIGNESGSYIVFPLEQSSYKVLKPSEVISLSLNLEIKQESEFENSSNLNLKVLEWTFDYIVRLIQMINRKVDRSVKTYEGSDVSPDELIENLIQAKNDAEKFSIKAQECSDNTEEKLLEIQNIYTEATTEIEKLHSDSINDIQSDLTAALVNISNAKVDAVSACEQEVEKAKEYSEETLSSLDEVRDVLEIANNRADTDLSNITSTAYDNLNQSKALATGDVSTNSIVYSDILNYAHSTFDLSKFTVVGSPTISDDGVASGFSASNYINTGYQLNNTSSSWQINSKFNFSTLGNLTIFCSSYLNNSATYNNPILVNIQQNGKIRLNLSSTYNYGSLLPDIAANITGNNTYETNTDYYIRLKFTGTQYILSYSLDGINYTDDIVITSSTQVAVGTLYIGIRLFVGTIGNYFIGSIDLKSFAIWADGVPVFNGNITGTDTIEEIEIPYTLAKSGAKIVDVAYRDRVQDLYTQTGEALYYTIDEQNQNFTLPMGEVYGMITQKANVDLTNLTNGLANVICMTAPTETSTASSQNPAVVIENYVNGTSGYRVYSDGYCEQWGETGQASSLTSHTITLLKPFANANYYANSVMTSSGSAKVNRISNRTTTQFTITKDTFGGGDPVTTNLWEAKGYIS